MFKLGVINPQYKPKGMNSTEATVALLENCHL